MSKVTSIIFGIILLIIGILALFPALKIAALWAAIVILIIGILSLIFGIVDKRKSA
ncbi:MAG: hypothetical protein H5T85_08520 [Actinobacteria bacterium]|nr:hypothetical protein [Actinomycetota bacterium]